MKIYYTCDCCGEAFDVLEVENIDENKLGFDCLNSDERRDILKYDALTNSLKVLSLCDACIEELGLADENTTINYGFVH
ncbi:MAG: putative protein family YabK [Firmicutes bacterium]|nr:putative protein family YabK [Bacillota bacterium]